MLDSRHTPIKLQRHNGDDEPYNHLAIIDFQGEKITLNQTLSLKDLTLGLFGVI